MLPGAKLPEGANHPGTAVAEATSGVKLLKSTPSSLDRLEEGCEQPEAKNPELECLSFPDKTKVPAAPVMDRLVRRYL